MTGQSFVILDTETTGLSPERGDAIIEVAAVKLWDDQVVDSFTALINPKIPISAGAAAVHGLSDAFISRHGKMPGEVFPLLYEFCQQAILVGHNIKKFDLPFINKHLLELNLQPLANPVLDTLDLARKNLRLPNYRLHTIADHFGIEYKEAHRAMADTMVNKDVFIRLFFQLNNLAVG